MKTVLTTDTFDEWFAGLKDNQGKHRIQMRIDRAGEGHFGDCKPVGDGVSEMRVDVGPGYRVYFMQRGDGLEIVVLLAGGDKSSQQRDIQQAIKLAKDIRG